MQCKFIGLYVQKKELACGKLRGIPVKTVKKLNDAKWTTSRVSHCILKSRVSLSTESTQNHRRFFFPPGVRLVLRR